MVKFLATAEDGNIHAVASSSDGPLLGELAALGVSTFDVNMVSKRSVLPSAVRLRRVIRAWSPDVVVLRGQFAGFAGALASFATRRTRIVYVCAYPSFYSNGSFLRNVRNWAVEFVSCRRASQVVVLNESDRAVYIDQHLARPTKISLIRNGVDTDKLEPQLSETVPDRVGFVGRLVEWKGVDVLIDAVSLLPEGIRSGLNVDIIGDGACANDLKSQASSVTENLGMSSPRFRFLGEIAATSEFYATCAVVIVPSRQEPFGIVAIEAMACGVPVIASRVGGLAETVLDGETGFLVPPGDPVALAGRIQQLLTDQALAREMARAARRRVVDKYSQTTMRYEYARTYTRAIEDRSRT